MLTLLLVAQGGLIGFVINTLILALVLMGAAYLLSGVTIEDYTRAIIVAVILAILNATLGWFLDFMTTPLRWITLGLFSLVVDAIVLMIAAYFIKGFTIRSFGTAFVMAVLLALANVIFGVL